jgi:hypothetical protein
MKTKTEKVLIILKVLALVGSIGFSIECGSRLLTFVASFINIGWAKRTYNADQDLFNVRDLSISFYAWAMFLSIVTSALKASVWYVVYDLLQKIKLRTPFSKEVEKKLEKITYLLLAIWLISGVFWKIYVYYLSKSTGIQLPVVNTGGEYFFIAGIVYIISQIFKRGIEMQEENRLTV